jgi:signal transduction histidine kinase
MLSFIVLAAITLANLMLASSVFFNNPRSLVNRIYAALVGTLAAWGVVVYLEDTSMGHVIIGSLARIDYSLAALMAMLFLLFCKQFVGLKNRVISGVAITAFLVILWLVASGATIRVTNQGSNIVFNPLYGFLPYVAYIAVAGGLGLWLLGRKYMQSTGKTRVQLKYIGTGFLLTILSIIASELIAPRLFMMDGPTVTRLGVYSTIFFAAFCWYAIARLRFMNLRLVVARSVAYVLLLTVLAGLYGFGSIGLSSIFFPGEYHSIAQDITYTALSVLVAFTFQPLKRILEQITTRLFYRDHYDSQVVINDFTKILVSELNMDRLLKYSLSALCEKLHIEFGQVVVFNGERVYRIEHFGPLPKRLMVAPELRKLNRSMLISDELPPGISKKTLDDHGVRLSMMLSTKSQFVGYLLLGNKLSGDIYSNQDVKLLEIAGSELAVAILNAKAFAEIQEFNMNLQARIDHATNRLRVANRHLKELDHAKDEFISMASHQLRTPLTTIKGYLSMMLEGDAGRMNGNQKQFVGYAFDASERMVNLISDLLNVSRMSAGKFLIQTKPTDMVQMIQDEVRQLQSHAKAKSISLIFEPPVNPLPPVEIDDNKTRQVVMNFIDNAIYYTSAGEVRVVLEQTGDSVRLEVRDTGIGVPQDAKKKLFSKFYRAENAQSVRPDGTGLGLYLAKRVVQDQGGTIIFNSVEGKGSTFGFVLPLNPQPAKHEEKNGRRLARK